MKKTLSLIFCLSLMISCNELLQDEEIEIVKNSPLDLGMGAENNYVIGDFVKEIAGISGSTDWQSFTPSDYKDQPSVRCVQVDITRNTDKNNLITMQYLLNKETEYVKLEYVAVDSVDVSRMDFYLILMEIGLDNLK